MEASHTPGHALQVGVCRKLSAHLSVCRSTGTDFIPLVAETLGGLGEDTIRTVAAIGRAIGDRSGSPDPSSTSKHLFGRLASSPVSPSISRRYCVMTFLLYVVLFCLVLVYIVLSCELGPEDALVSSFQREVCTGFNGVGT